MVRESQGSAGQYVLTGMQSGHHKHLLLVDPEGVVSVGNRTETVSNQVNESMSPCFDLGAHQRPDVRQREPLDQLPPKQRAAHHIGRERAAAQEASAEVAPSVSGRNACY